MAAELNPPNISPKPLGFGEHVNPITDSKQVERADRVYKIALYVLIGLAAAAVIALSIVCPLIPAVIIPCIVAASVTLGLSAGFAVASYLRFKFRKDAYVGIVNHLKVAQNPIQQGQYSKCDVASCKDGVEAFTWKKKLIESAQHNIVLSGSYCGGNSFDEVLDLIDKQMKAKAELKVLILNADKFSNPSNKMKVAKLKQSYPDRFQMVTTPDIWILNPSLKRTTNHAKILSIDYGSYFLIGGSSLEDKYAFTRGLGGPDTQPMSTNGGILDSIVANGFRDQDFVFRNQDSNGVGKRVYLEALKLVWRWNAMNQAGSGWAHEGIESLQNSSSVVGKLLQEQVEGKDTKNPTSTIITDFKPVADKADVKVFCMGPEHVDNPFEAELVDQFDKATKRIVINHLYFHPTQKVFDALVRAANRGINVYIVTNGFESSASPLSHKLFGLRNQYNCAQLVRAVDKKAKQNIDIREFKVKSVTLHNKVVVVDDYLITGSSNIGYKSLVTMSDHEICCVVKNSQLADLSVLRAYIDGRSKYSQRSVNPEAISPCQAIVAGLHRTLAPLIG